MEGKRNIPYIGNGAYCYANSTAMLLSYIGEEIQPLLIEVLSGCSMGASLYKEKNILYFDNPTLLPDLGITKVLDILGFTSKTKVFDNPEDFPIEELKKDLEVSPAILGPLDMGFLVYNPNHTRQKGADHFVLAYEIEGSYLHLHDPAGFPHVFISLDELRESWKADELDLPYNKGYYRYIFSPKRIVKPSIEEIYTKGISFFRTIYKQSETEVDKNKIEVGSRAILLYATYVQRNGLNAGEKAHFTHFALPLGAKRASDYGHFFQPFNQELSELKFEQSSIFGTAHTCAMKEDWKLLAEVLTHLSEVEKRFEVAILNI